MGLDEGILWKYLQIKNVPLKIYLTTFHSHKKRLILCGFLVFSRTLDTEAMQLAKIN